MNRIFTKIRNFTGIIILIAGILLCSAAPLMAMAEIDSSCSETSSVSTHAGGMTNACGDQHSNSGQHSFSFITSLNLLTSLIGAAFVFFMILSWKTLFSIERDLTRLNLFQYLHQVFVKPKLEAFLRWLNLLGGTIALSV